MKPVLLVAAASLATFLIPGASAQALTNGSHFRNGPSAPPGPFVSGRPAEGRFAPGFACDGRDMRRRDGRAHGAIDGCAAFPAGWGYFDQDINRSWAPDSFNDWWNDRPDRAYPRWIFHNQDCTPDRMWWSGSGWHC
jgi:hypothetical protein